MFTSGAVVFIMSALRVLVVRLPETPKYLVASGQEEKLVAVLQNIAAKHKRSCFLTLEMLQDCGQIQHQGATSHQLEGRRLAATLIHQVKGLFETRKSTLSTILVWISWLGIGLGYPLFFLYLP